MCARRLHWAVVGGIETGDSIGENLVSIRYGSRVASDRVQPPPDGVTSVVPSDLAVTEQIGNQSMAKTTTVGKDQVARFFVTTVEEKETAKRDERVSTPVSPDARTEMRKAGGQRWALLDTFARVFVDFLCRSGFAQVR